ncbi:MAG: apolipoprotein N-acyltransferase [Actinobacteria bacterium]|nr:apolipoprotein N-acyltransferase [Actinomycetota bacterium]
MRRLGGLGLPAATGVLGAIAFPPFDLGPLALVAPIPLFVAWREGGGNGRAGGPRRAAADGFIAGFVFFGIVISWSWHFGVVAYVPFVATLAGYWAGAGALVGLFARRGMRHPMLTSSIWVTFEALRGRWPFGGFSWGEVGYAFHDVPVARSLAGWGGVLAVSLASTLVAATVVEAWAAGEWRGRLVALSGVGAVVLITVAAHAALPETRPAGALAVAVVQGNDKNRDLTAEELDARYLPRSHFELARGLSPPLDLVILPESSLDEDPRVDPSLEEGLAEIAQRLDSAVLANAAVEIEGGRRLHNTNFLYDPAGRLVGTYVKQHLVPYGEYVPGRRFLEGLIDELEQIPRDHAPGDRRVIFDVGGARIANLICFESAFTELARGYARDGAGVLVVSTNNRSFGRSANAAQHVAIGQMRAAETGRPLVQAAISGRSAFIDHRGDIRATTELFESTTLVRSVEARTGRTPYVVVGDWALALALAVILGFAVRLAVGTGRFLD